MVKLLFRNPRALSWRNIMDVDKKIEELTAEIINCFSNEKIMSAVKTQILREWAKEFPIYSDIHFFVNMIFSEVDEIKMKTEVLINIEKPNAYLCLDALTQYIEKDSRAMNIRRKLEDYLVKDETRKM
mgnify:CR=1 FL=1|tara:strand:+ start:6480 stop:6863 length:384 start_codon:yes stop_codon:yes gene_type:complete